MAWYNRARHPNSNENPKMNDINLGKLERVEVR